MYRVHNKETSVYYVMHDAHLAALFIKTLPGPNGGRYESSRAVRPRFNTTEVGVSVPQPLCRGTAICDCITVCFALVAIDLPKVDRRTVPIKFPIKGTRPEFHATIRFK
jgi:hypothetical protein